MASIKISELNTLASVTNDDYFPIVDSGSATTFRATLNTLNSWLFVSASVLSASHAENADDAISASYALSSSWAFRSVSASYALTASYYDVVGSGYAPVNATSASYALTASCLHGRGVSWEQTLQISNSLIIEKSASIMIPRKRFLEPSNEPAGWNAIFFNKDYGTEAASNDWARVHYSETTTDNGRLSFELGDNLSTLLPIGPDIESAMQLYGGFLWGVMHTYAAPYATGSLMFLQHDGRLLARALEARNFTSSLIAGVGFVGTASYALNCLSASYLIGGISTGSVQLNPMPATVQGLVIYPHWQGIDNLYYNVDVRAKRIVVKHISGSTVSLENVNLSNDRTVVGAGGVVGTYTQNQWYDVYIVYRSDTTATQSVIVPSGVNPDTTNFSGSVFPTLGSPWTYAEKVGSVYDNSGQWTQWIELGPRRMFAYRNDVPTSYGLSSYGFTIPHKLGQSPREVNLRIKLKTMNTELSTAGFQQGDEINGDDTVSYVSADGDEGNRPAFFLLSNATYVKVARTYGGAWVTHSPNGFQLVIQPENWAFVVYCWE